MGLYKPLYPFIPDIFGNQSGNIISVLHSVLINFSEARLNVQLEKYGAMITVLYIGQNLRRNQIIFQWFCNIEVIKPPAFILQPYAGKTLGPPGILVRIRMKRPEERNKFVCS